MRRSHFDTHDVKRICENKLGIQFRQGKELNGWFRLYGKKAARITVPKGKKPVPPKTYKSMAFQLKLSVEELDSLLQCPLSKGDYIDLLSRRVNNE